MLTGRSKKVRNKPCSTDSLQRNSAYSSFRFLGDSFAAGDVLLEIETDKAQMDVEAQDDGKVFKIFV